MKILLQHKLKRRLTLTLKTCTLALPVLLGSVLLAGCLAEPVVKKSYGDLHNRQSQTIEDAVQDTAQTGDWLVIRGYHGVDNLVANATGLPISHVGIYDRETETVIEAEGKGIHTTHLSEFVDKSYRLMVIRPRWQTKDNAEKAMGNARNLVGKSYDFLGTIGFNFPDQYYCSELAVQIYKPWHRDSEKFPQVIKPGELYLYGKVLYDSLPRDEM